MSEDVKNLDAEDIQEQASEEVLNDEELVIEGAEEEVEIQEESVEDLEEAKVKKEMGHDDDSEKEEEEESVQPKAVEIPKTKAGVINKNHKGISACLI